jgi:xylan 1,4-beta-xylosidase
MPTRRRTMQWMAGGALAAAARLTTAQPPAPFDQASTPAPLPGAPVDPDDNSGRPVDPPVKGYYAYRGTSGPGLPVTDATATGGWVSGGPGVRYRGPAPMPYPTLPWQADDTGAAVTMGLIPPIRPMLDLHIRDTQICLGGDGHYYMTGSTGDNIWKFNDGVELWRSPDLARWDYLGLVWSIERDGVWEKQWRMRAGVPFRALWAPEIHYLRGNYFICHSMSRSGLAILKSTTGKPEGPYVHAFSPEKHLRKGIDATLFEDDDGAVYFTYGAADEIVRLKDDFSGYAEEWRPVKFLTPDHDRAHHRTECASKGWNDLGYEGASLFKRRGVYHLCVVDRFDDRYSFAISTSKSIYGPYSGRYESIPCAGGGNFFRDKQGGWWTTFFGNDAQSPFREKPGIIKVEFGRDGRACAAKSRR